ncbi:cytidylate kinase [Thermoplasmatales archaeon SW_10_69_26]|jgi:cytidylate kinase|nr:MAG: cytidylate kinase [Thermoplasmatales archaeon SW_10_69_26]
MLITLSGLPGSGTTTAARLVCHDLDLDHVTAGMIFRNLAVERNMTLEEFSKYAEEHPEVDWELDRRMANRAKDGEVVLEGRLTAWMMEREGIDALKVWLTAPEEVRAERVAQREGLTKDQALEANRTREESERKRYEDIYEIDLTDLSVYNLQIDTHKHDPDEVSDQIVETADEVFDIPDDVLADGGDEDEE